MILGRTIRANINGTDKGKDIPRPALWPMDNFHRPELVTAVGRDIKLPAGTGLAAAVLTLAVVA